MWQNWRAILRKESRNKAVANTKKWNIYQVESSFVSLLIYSLFDALISDMKDFDIGRRRRRSSIVLVALAWKNELDKFILTYWYWSACCDEKHHIFLPSHTRMTCWKLVSQKQSGAFIEWWSSSHQSHFFAFSIPRNEFSSRQSECLICQHQKLKNDISNIKF